MSDKTASDKTVSDKKSEKKAQTPLHALGGPPPERSPEQRWVLASQGILTELYNANHLRMGGMPRPLCANFGALFLRRDWGVKSRKAALACIEDLLAHGGRNELAEAVGCEAHEICAWDYVRASAVAGWAYLAYHLEADEAWPFMVEAARRLQASYGSWKDVGDAYLRARSAWSSGGKAELGPKIAKLLAPGGGWDFPWEIDISGEIEPATETLREVVVDKAGGDGVFVTLKEAMSAVVASDACARIVVRAGHYQESVTIRFPVEIVADGEVTIESNEGAPIVSQKQNALVRGVTLVSGQNEAGQTMQGVFHKGFHLKLEGCTIRSARCGVYALTKNAFLVMERCRIESAANSGVLLEDGAHASIVETTIQNTGFAGILAKGDGELSIESSRVEDSKNSGLAVSEGVWLELDGLHVERAGHNGVELLGHGAATLRRLHVRASAQTGVFSNRTSITLDECDVQGSTGNDLGVAGGGAIAIRSTFGGGPGCGVCVATGARARLEHCTVESTAMASVIVMGGATGVFFRSTLKGGRDIAVWSMPDASLTLLECEVTGGAKTGVLLREARDTYISGGSITSDVSALFAVGSHAVIVKDARLTGGAPAVCVQGETDLVVADTSIESVGAVGLAVEEGAHASLARARLRAETRALVLEKAAARAYASKFEGDVLVDDGSTFAPWASDIGGAVTGALVVGAFDEKRHAPGRLTFGVDGRVCLELSAESIGPALKALASKSEPGLVAIWLDAALAGEVHPEAIEIVDTDQGASLVARSIETLHACAASLRKQLKDKPRLSELAKRIKAERDAPTRREADA